MPTVVGELQDGMTLGVGGWGPRRKPMALIRELLRSDVKDLTVVAYGGPEVGMLGAAGKVRKLIYGFVSLDTVPIEPRPGPNPRTTLSRSEEQRAIIRQLDQHDIRATVLKGNPPGVRPA